MTPPIVYQLSLDTDEDQTYDSPIDDITQYLVGQIQWQEGMGSAYEEVAPPARLVFTLSNRGGEFDREGYLSGELIVNGGFDNWTSDDPDGWTELNEAVNQRVISQVGINDLFPDTGTGACNIYNNGLTSVFTGIRQSPLTVGKTYELRIAVTTSVNDVIVPGAHLPHAGLQISAGTVITESLIIPGQYSFIFQATSTDLTIRTVVDEDLSLAARTNSTFDDVSVREVSRYRMMRKGMLVRLRSTYNGTTTTEFIGKIADMQFVPGKNQEPLLTVTVEDAMLQLLDKEYAPPLMEAVTVDEPITRMLDEGVIRWPYNNYWLLGVQGRSELGITTTLYGHSATNFDTGVTELSFVGDVADRGQGVNAQQYIRDLMAAEAGGRFFYNPRTAQFDLHNRHRDTLNDTIAGTYTDFDLDSVQFNHGKEIVNNITVNFTAREIGAASTILWSYPGVPFQLKNNAKAKTFTARYVDTSDAKRRIGGKDFITPLAGVDTIANTAQDGSGADMSDKITVSHETTATGAKISVFNNSGLDVYITTLQIRGTPLIQQDITVTSLSGDSIRDYDEHSLTADIRLMDDEDQAQNYADWQIARFKDPLTRIESATFNSLRSETMTEATINRVIGDKVTLQLAANNHDADYIIVGKNTTINTGGDHNRTVTWILKPAQRETFWVLGIAGKSELDISTRLGF